VFTVVFFHAHPDDEAIATGGTMAALSDQGHRVVLVTATPGELGEIPDGLLEPGETLVERRRAELAEACEALGVSRHVELGYHDSGMAGEDSNRAPGSFAAADLGEAADRLADVLREERADALVIYDEHGVYDHPDHVKVHDVGRLAADRAATRAVYLVTLDRDRLQAMVSAGLGPPDAPDRDLTTMGEPAWRITTEIDVRHWIEAKRAAMAAHRSQIGPDSFFLAMPDEVFTEVWGSECYIRVRPDGLEQGQTASGAREPGLRLGASGGAGTLVPSATART
jgi:LmbE family N-acetylglucosaminyl deacetylase